MHRLILHNGEIRDAGERLLSAGQVGFLNGWGVFSTLRVMDGVLFAFERHYSRLLHDAKLLHVPFTVSAEKLRASLLLLVEANKAYDSVLRVAVVRNKGGLFEGSGLHSEAELVAFTADLNKWGQSARLTCVPNARFAGSQFAGTKTTSWGQNLTLYEEAHERGFDEALLFNEHGNVSECTSANIFVIEGRRVYTPPLSTSGCLPGVTRAILLEEIRAEDITVSERELNKTDLEASDCVFITSTTRDLLPVSELDGVALRQERELLDVLHQGFVENRTAYITSSHAAKQLVGS